MGWFSRDPEPTAPAGPVPGTVDALAAATVQLVRWLRSLGGQLPPRAMELCRITADHLDDVVADPASQHLDVQTLVTLERTASAHVPDTVNAYLAAREVAGAEDMLLDQLGTLEKVARSASDRSRQSARDAFEIQGSFLQEKFRNG